MPTILSFLSGRQITNDSGVPQSGAQLFHYRETTLTPLTVWQDEAGTVPHGPPTGVVTTDSGGFVPLVFIDDTFDWKVIIKTAAGVTLKTYDELSAAEPAVAAATFSLTKFPWTQVSNASSPVTLTAADAGKAYEADTTGGNVEFDLPAAASMANGTGFIFKKTVAANSMIIDPNGAETIDDVSASLAITEQYQVVCILSNVAEWYVAWKYVVAVTVPTVQRFTSGSGTYTPAAGVRYIRVRMVGGGGGGGAQVTNAGAAGVTSAFATPSWTAVGGGLGAAGGGGAAGAGGTGGANGTGTLIARFDGQDGGQSANFNPTTLSGGGSSVFGGGGAVRDRTTGGSAKANTGSGGAGAGNTVNQFGGSGGAGEYVEFLAAAVPHAYVVGTGGAGGAAGTTAGGNGAAGVIIVEEYY